jgi:hypothetical protein
MSLDPAAEWHSAFPVPQRANRRTVPRHKEAGCQQLPTSMSSCPTKSRRFHFHVAHPRQTVPYRLQHGPGRIEAVSLCLRL